jgi:two-component sensor histidine kinase
VNLRAVEGRGELVIADDGVGVVDSNAPKTKGLGTQLLPNLVRQLGGELTTRADGGLRVTITFPL